MNIHPPSSPGGQTEKADRQKGRQVNRQRGKQSQVSNSYQLSMILVHGSTTSFPYLPPSPSLPLDRNPAAHVCSLASLTFQLRQQRKTTKRKRRS
mmetsp:Transcript_9055/g.17736  ORF Transcript_9055/g.17736 Transcript_9055/m.17736 type:complete len:95 (-) Transcript_9055:376-660(-)